MEKKHGGFPRNETSAHFRQRKWNNRAHGDSSKVRGRDLRNVTHGHDVTGLGRRDTARACRVTEVAASGRRAVPRERVRRAAAEVALAATPARRARALPPPLYPSPIDCRPDQAGAARARSGAIGDDVTADARAATAGPATAQQRAHCVKTPLRSGGPLLRSNCRAIVVWNCASLFDPMPLLTYERCTHTDCPWILIEPDRDGFPAITFAYLCGTR
ncbi:unnamed protein product, partial [Iphiclides podalirius]